MLYPLPAVMVSCGAEKENYNIITIAWTGTVCTNPPMTYISVRPERHSYNLIKASGAFVINLTTETLAFATDYAGVRSGAKENKFDVLKLTPEPAMKVNAPVIAECPVNIECRVVEIKELGSHHMFLAEVVNVQVDNRYMDENGKFHLNDTGLIAYSHGTYFSLGKELGTFGYSVRKKSRPSNARRKARRKGRR